MTCLDMQQKGISLEHGAKKMPGWCIVKCSPPSLTQKALTTETRGQNAWFNFGKHNYDQEGKRLPLTPSATLRKT